jgi:hypothetical protein
MVSADKRVKHHIKIMLEEEFNAKEGREREYFQTHNWELETTSG